MEKLKNLCTLIEKFINNKLYFILKINYLILERKNI